MRGDGFSRMASGLATCASLDHQFNVVNELGSRRYRQLDQEPLPVGCHLSHVNFQHVQFLKSPKSLMERIRFNFQRFLLESEDSVS